MFKLQKIAIKTYLKIWPPSDFWTCWAMASFKWSYYALLQSLDLVFEGVLEHTLMLGGSKIS